MITARHPRDEEARLATLAEYEILDSLPEQVYDRIVRLASAFCDTPIALVSLVDRERQWFKAAVGLEASETPRDISFCGHAVASGQILVVPDAQQDQRFADNPLVVSSPNIRFYAGIPIAAHTGQYLGTLCVIDDKPRRLDARALAVLRELAHEVEAHLELRRLHRRLEFVVRQRALQTAMIAHDGRNMITSIYAAVRKLSKDPAVVDRHRDTLAGLEGAVDGMARLCQTVEQVAASERGEVETQFERRPFGRFFEELVGALTRRAESSGHRLKARNEIEAEVETDFGLLRRIVSNLVDNACKYSPSGSAVDLAVRQPRDDFLRVEVCDRGRGVAASDRERVFEPLYRAAGTTEPGSGLGLAFCQLATEALGGSIGVGERDDGRTEFWVEVPIR